MYLYLWRSSGSACRSGTTLRWGSATSATNRAFLALLGAHPLSVRCSAWYSRLPSIWDVNGGWLCCVPHGRECAAIDARSRTRGRARFSAFGFATISITVITHVLKKICERRALSTRVQHTLRGIHSRARCLCALGRHSWAQSAALPVCDSVAPTRHSPKRRQYEPPSLRTHPSIALPLPRPHSSSSS